jgi:hypothetical protein
MGRPNVAQIFLVAVCIYFVAQGWVPLEILPFPLLSSIYIFLLSRYIAPPVTSKVEPGLFDGSRLLRNYVLFAAFLGLLLPLVYATCTYIQGDLVALKEAVPPLFLLIIQVLTENYTYTRPQFSVLIRPLVAILYNTRRVFCIWNWMMFLFGTGVEKPDASSAGLVLFGRVLAVANTIFWNYNLFAFLIPVFLVNSMRKYFELEKKVKE